MASIDFAAEGRHSRCPGSVIGNQVSLDIRPCLRVRRADRIGRNLWRLRRYQQRRARCTGRNSEQHRPRMVARSSQILRSPARESSDKSFRCSLGADGAHAGQLLGRSGVEFHDFPVCDLCLYRTPYSIRGKWKSAVYCARPLTSVDRPRDVSRRMGDATLIFLWRRHNRSSG